MIATIYIHFEGTFSPEIVWGDEWYIVDSARTTTADEALKKAQQVLAHITSEVGGILQVCGFTPMET